MTEADFIIIIIFILFIPLSLIAVAIDENKSYRESCKLKDKPFVTTQKPEIITYNAEMSIPKEMFNEHIECATQRQILDKIARNIAKDRNIVFKTNYIDDFDGNGHYVVKGRLKVIILPESEDK